MQNKRKGMVIKMMTKKQLFIPSIFFFLLMIISFVSAQDSIQFNPGALVNITGIKCLEKNESICSDDIVCNITVINDTQDFLVLNQEMYLLPNAFRGYDAGYAPNYTAEWSAVASCDNGGITEFIIFIGETKTDWETGFIIGMVGLIAIYALSGFFIFDKEYWMLKSFLFFSAFGMLIVLINSAKIFAIGTNSNTIMNMGLLIAITSLSVMFLYLFVFFFIGIIKSLKDKRGVRWNY